MLDKDIGIIRAASPNSMVDDTLLARMEHETRELSRTAKNSTAFEVDARWPTHGDLYEGNSLLTDDGAWYVFDWDDLALGDPVADYIIILPDSILEKDAGFCRVVREVETWGMGRRERRALEERWRMERRRSLPSESAVFRYLEMFHARRDPDNDWCSYGVEATDDGFDERMRFYARAALLYVVVDGLAEHLGLDASDPLLSATSREKREAFEKGLAPYRERYS